MSSPFPRSSTNVSIDAAAILDCYACAVHALRRTTILPHMRVAIIGTGAICKLDDTTCELKRVWLLFDYHGRGLGYRLIQELLGFARKKGYQRIRLETDRHDQRRAYQLYRRLGFYEIPRYSDNTEDAAMEMMLQA